MQEVHLTLQLGGVDAVAVCGVVQCGAVWCSEVQCAVVQGGKGWCIVKV